MSSTAGHDEVPELDLMAYIATGTVATREVTIHNDPALADELQALYAQLDAANAAIKQAGGDAPLDAEDPRPAIEARIGELAERWDASKSVWTVRALSRDEIDATFEPEKGGIAHPRQPVAPPAAAGQKALEKHAEKVTEWARAVHEADRARTLVMIASAVTDVVTVHGARHREAGDPPIVTPVELAALRDRPHGEQWVGHIPSGRGAGQKVTGRLAQAVTAATNADGEVSRPQLPERSTTTQS